MVSALGPPEAAHLTTPHQICAPSSSYPAAIIEPRCAVAEHDDDLEPEVDEDAEFESETYAILEDDDEGNGAIEDVDDDLNIDPDESEI